ncbi:MAG TPA: PQQ-dependent sugar dehydrogenase [Thermoanaerobaculia bacterium]|nr:PQQ-dependent sugar dehydrogenase [Thermoanaerobaculia bacterium]
MTARCARAQGGPEIALEPLATGLAQPTAIAHAGDARLFLTLQRGRIVVFENGAVRPTAFLDVTPLVSCCGERGLLGLAFHPRYAENGLFFVNYTNTGGNTVVARYRVSAADRNVADPSSAATLLTIAQPFANHNGGHLAFGPDGYLYVGMGDGGSGNDPMCAGQRDDTLLGKMLRIDVDANAGAPPFYGIPPDNPFAAPGGARDEIWAKGLRNPWRFSFDRATGDLYIGDVGQGSREEIDFQPAGSAGGENYGWKMMEGTLCTGGTSGCPSGVAACNAPSLTLPILEYSHSSGDCSVTGGYVYRGRLYPRLTGTYFYGDYCTGKVWGAVRDGGSWTTRLYAQRASNLTTFGEDSAGELYLATEAGVLARVADANPMAPTVTAMEPASGSARGGDVVVLTGGGFATGAAVTFGGAPGTDVAVLDSIGTRLRVVTPAHAVGTVDVVVTNPDGRSVTVANGYAFTALTRVTPPPGPPRTVTRP